MTAGAALVIADLVEVAQDLGTLQAGSPTVRWLSTTERLNALRRLAFEAGRHDAVLLADVTFLLVNAADEEAATKWRAIRDLVKVMVRRESARGVA